MKKIYLIMIFAGMMAGLPLFTGCNDENDDIILNSKVPKVYNIYNSGCLSNMRSEEADALPTVKYEKIRLKVLVDNRLQIAHDSVNYSCGADLEIHCSKDGNHINIWEKNVSDVVAECVCPYNLSYEIPLEYGQYTLQINDGTVYSFKFSAATDTTILVGLSLEY